MSLTLGEQNTLYVYINYIKSLHKKETCWTKEQKWSRNAWSWNKIIREELMAKKKRCDTSPINLPLNQHPRAESCYITRSCNNVKPRVATNSFFWPATFAPPTRCWAVCLTADVYLILLIYIYCKNLVVYYKC